MEPKDGYQPGVLRVVYVDVDANGNIIQTNVPKEGYNSGVYRIDTGSIDEDGDFVPS